MAQFKDVFSTTAKVLLTLLIISAAIGAGFLILGSIPSGDPDGDCERDTACREAKANVERVKQDQKAEREARMRDLKIKLVYLRDGDAAGDLYVRCISDDPPKQPANQKRCQGLLDHLQKEDAARAAAEAKADAKAKANW